MQCGISPQLHRNKNRIALHSKPPIKRATEDNLQQSDGPQPQEAAQSGINCQEHHENEDSQDANRHSGSLEKPHESDQKYLKKRHNKERVREYYLFGCQDIARQVSGFSWALHRPSAHLVLCGGSLAVIFVHNSIKGFYNRHYNLFVKCCHPI